MHLGNEKQVQVVRMSGVNYNFEFIHGTKGQRRIFSIRAINKCNGRFSSINNLNTILSLLYVEPNKTKFEDSLWEINMKEIEAYKNIIIEALSDNEFLLYLEDKLDEDRFYGEWENIAD